MLPRKSGKNGAMKLSIRKIRTAKMLLRVEFEPAITGLILIRHNLSVLTSFSNFPIDSPIDLFDLN